MKHHTLLLFFAAIVLTSAVNAQHLGVPKLNDEFPKTAVLIEKARTQRVEQFIPVPGVNLPNKLASQMDTNIYIKVWADQTVYDPIGSGVILTISNLLFLATANHVVADDGDVHFRIPQKNGGEARHQQHLRDILDWVRDTKSDLAVAALGICEDTDDVRAIPVESFLVDYDDVKVGDEVFVLGFPSSVVLSQNPSVHYLRNGVVSSKPGPPEIIIDAFLFPGNSGGPVYWKQATGIHFGSGLSGTDVPGRESKLIGLVSRTLQYSEEARSPQTGRTRVIFEENSGLAVVISSTALKRLMERPEITSFIERVKRK